MEWLGVPRILIIKINKMELYKIEGYLRNSDVLNILSADTAFGKTTIATNIAYESTMEGNKVLFLTTNTDESIFDIIFKIVSSGGDTTQEEKMVILDNLNGTLIVKSIILLPVGEIIELVKESGADFVIFDDAESIFKFNRQDKGLLDIFKEVNNAIGIPSIFTTTTNRQTRVDNIKHIDDGNSHLHIKLYDKVDGLNIGGVYYNGVFKDTITLDFNKFTIR